MVTKRVLRLTGISLSIVSFLVPGLTGLLISLTGFILWMAATFYEPVGGEGSNL